MNDHYQNWVNANCSPDDLDEPEEADLPQYDPREDDPAELAAREAYEVQESLLLSAECLQIEIERVFSNGMLPMEKLQRIKAIIDEREATP